MTISTRSRDQTSKPDVRREARFSSRDKAPITYNYILEGLGPTNSQVQVTLSSCYDIDIGWPDRFNYIEPSRSSGFDKLLIFGESTMSSAPNNAIKARELPESLAPHSQYSTSEEDYCSWYDARARHTASTHVSPIPSTPRRSRGCPLFPRGRKFHSQQTSGKRSDGRPGDKLRDVTTPIAPKKKFPISTQSTSRKESLKGKTVDRPVVERVSEKGNGHNAPDPVIDVGHDHESCSLTSQKSEPIHKLIHDGLVRENDTAKPPKDLSAETSTSIAACPQIDAEKSLHTPLSPSNANAMTPSFTTISDQPSTSQTLATPSCEEIRSEGNDNQANTLIENHLDADQNISEEDSYELQALILHLKLVDLYSSPNGLLYQDRYTRSAPSDPQSSHHGSASFDSQSAGGSASENSTDSTGRKHGRSNDTYNGSGKADDPELKRARSKPPLPKDVRNNLACPFAKGLPNEYICCLHINRQNLVGIREHLKRTHFNGTVPHEIIRARTWESIFQFCHPGWEFPVPSPYYDPIAVYSSRPEASLLDADINSRVNRLLPRRRIEASAVAFPETRAVSTDRQVDNEMGSSTASPLSNTNNRHVHPANVDLDLLLVQMPMLHPALAGITQLPRVPQSNNTQTSFKEPSINHPEIQNTSAAAKQQRTNNIGSQTNTAQLAAGAMFSSQAPHLFPPRPPSASSNLLALHPWNESILNTYQEPSTDPVLSGAGNSFWPAGQPEGLVMNTLPGPLPSSGITSSHSAFCGPLGFTQAPLFEESSLTNAKAFIQKGKKKEKKYVFQVARKPALPKHTTSETSLPKKFLFDDMDEFRKGFESWMTFQFHDPPFSWDTSEFENPDRSVRLQSLDELVAELDFKYVMDPHLSRNAGCFLVLKEVD